MTDAWRAYLEMALGLTEAPRKKAQRAVGDLVNRGGATAAQLQGLVEDLMSTGVANREALTNIVRYEVDKALGVVGLATAEEVSELTTRVRDLEKQLRDAQARATAAESGTDGTVLDRPAPVPARKTVAKKAVKAPPNKMPAAATSPAAPSKAPAKKVAPPPAPAKKVAPPPAPAKKVTPPAPATDAPAKKVTPAAPAGTAESPVAGVKEAAAATELPTPAKAAQRKKAAKKAAPKPKTES